MMVRERNTGSGSQRRTINEAQGLARPTLGPPRNPPRLLGHAAWLSSSPRGFLEQQARAGVPPARRVRGACRQRSTKHSSRYRHHRSRGLESGTTRRFAARGPARRSTDKAGRRTYGAVRARRPAIEDRQAVPSITQAPAVPDASRSPLLSSRRLSSCRLSERS